MKLAKNIKKLIEDEKFYNEITDKAQTFIRQYDYKVLAQKFMEVYKDVLSEEWLDNMFRGKGSAIWEKFLRWYIIAG